MMLSKKKQYVLAGVLVILVGSVFLFVSPAQDDVSLEQSSLPNRAPEGYAVPARDVVTLPFTHVSADRLRLGNVREVSRGMVRESTPIIVSPPPFFIHPRSPDGQWTLSYSEELLSASLGNLSVTRVDGSGERNVLFTDTGYGSDDFRTSIYPHFPPRVVWSWDSNRIFYRLWRRTQDSITAEYEGWIESADIRTGEVTRHPDIGFYSNLHSYATARHPTDPVLFDDSPDYQLKGPRGIKTRDGSASWVIDDFHPLYLSPDKQMVLGYGYDDAERSGIEEEYGRQYLIYAIDGTGPLYNFYLSGHLTASINLYLREHSDAPIWSPDGSKLVYEHVTERADDTDMPVASDLYLINIDGTGKTNLTNTPDIPEYFQGWTADGRLVFVVFDADKGGWHIADLVIE